VESASHPAADPWARQDPFSGEFMIRSVSGLGRAHGGSRSLIIIGIVPGVKVVVGRFRKSSKCRIARVSTNNRFLYNILEKNKLYLIILN